MKKVLELPAFRRLLVATIFNELAWWIGSVSLALLIYRRTGSAFGAASFFLCSQFAPALVSPLLVARLDQAVKSRMLAELYVLEAAIFALLAWFARHFSLVPILALVLLDGALFMTARVLTRTAWASVTSSPGLVREANALFSGSLSVCIMAGPALGGGLVALGGASTALLVNVGMFVLVGGFVLTTKGVPPAVGDDSGALSRFRAALRYVQRDSTTRRLLGLQGLAVVFFTISLPIEVVFVQHTLRGGAGGYGLLLAVWGGGAVLGGVMYARWRRLPSRQLITFGAGTYGVGFFLMAVAPTLAVAVIGAGIAGVGNGSQYVAFRAALQERTPDEWMPMVLSLNESLFQAVPGVGILVGAAITALVGPRPALATAAAGSLVVACAMWFGVGPEGSPETQAATSGQNEPSAQSELSAQSEQSAESEAQSSSPPLTIGEPQV